MVPEKSDFWQLLVDSRLFTSQQCEQLAGNFVESTDDAAASPKTVARWLASQNLISRYQAGILLSGRPGPFHYGEYKIYDRIEKGSLKGVFRAVHTTTNHPVTLHFVGGTAAHDADRWKQLCVLPQLVHANIVRCWQAVDLGSYKFLVCEDLRGASVADVVKNEGRVSLAEACRMTRHAAAGLAELHESGRAHGDVQPRNLWRNKSGDLQLLVGSEIDLRPLDQTLPDDRKAHLRRADYLAPELSRPGQAPDPLTDIYALGCTLYELIAGQPPFPGGTVADKLERHASEAPPPFDRTDGAHAVYETVARMIAKNPEQRWEDASVVAEQLATFAEPVPTKVREPAPISTQAAFEQSLQAPSPPAPAPPEPRISPPAPREDKPHGTLTPSSNSEPAPFIAINEPGALRGKSRTGGPAGNGVIASKVSTARSRQRKNLVLLVGSAGLSVVLIGVSLFFLSNMSTSVSSGSGEQTAGEPKIDKADVPLADDAIPPGGPDDASDPLNSQDSDDGHALWASPTSGAPIELNELPGGAQLFFYARPAEIMDSGEGQRVLQALGPDFAALRAKWETASGFGFQDIDQLVVGLYGDAGPYPVAACVVRLVDEVSREDLLRLWGSPTESQIGEATYYTRGGSAFYIPAGTERSTFVIGHEDQIKHLVESGGGPPLLRREIAQLLRVSDRLRHLTILFAPSFLFSDGRTLFEGERAKVLDPLESLLGDDLKAGLVSAHFGQPFYFEMRMESDIVIDRFTLASNFRDRLARIPDAMETYIAALNPHLYWRRVAFRFPAMVRFMHGQTRVGIEGNHALINAALPQTAAHNLVFGAEMALASTPEAVLMPPTGPVPGEPRSLDDLLSARMSISFDQDSLEFSMRNVETEIRSMFNSLPFQFKIKIQGDDLKLEGITRNQQIRDFLQQDETVASVLTAMVMKANPVTTVKEPSEPDQKLLWVIAPDPENPTNRIILITTRQIAEQNYTLPAVFRSR